MTYTSFRDIPGVTEEEIKAVEELQAKYSHFTYGTVPSTEIFLNEDGEIGGFSAFICEWLSSLFDIRFEPTLALVPDMVGAVQRGEYDFSGDIQMTEERRQIFFATDPIALRSLVAIRLKDSPPLNAIAASRPLRYIFLRNSIYISDVAAVSEPGSYETILVDLYSGHSYPMLKNGEADALIIANPAEAQYDDYDDLVIEDFLPLIFNPVSLATVKPEFSPIISVVQKALDDGAFNYLNDLYYQGYQDYKKYKLRSRLSAEELAFIKNNPEISIAARHDNYPVSFYSARDNAWKGISFDILREVERFTGLTFKISNDRNMGLPELLQLFDEGEAMILSDLIRTPEREGWYSWPDTPFLTDRPALISGTNHRNIKVSEVYTLKIGLSRGTYHTDLFHRWFPDHRNTVEYDTQEAAFEALVRGEVDMVMSSAATLLWLTSYLELPEFKANVVFNQPFETTFALHTDADVLHSIIEKVLRVVDTEAISSQWLRQTYDYRYLVAQARRPLLIGAIVLSLMVLTLVFVLFIRSRNIGKQLEKLVMQRTGELQQRTGELELQTSTLRTMVDSIPDIIFCQDADLRFTLCNKFLLEFFGVTMDKVLDGENIERLVMSSEDADKAIGINQKVINERKKIAYEEWLQSADGSNHLFETIKVPVIIEGIAAGILGIARDITERKAMEEAAQAANRSKSAFLANMSHEMRTPMNVVVGLTDLMLEEEDPTIDLKDNLRKISTAGNTLLGLINDVLDISKIEAGRLELMLDKYEIPSLLSDITTLNTIRIESKPIALHLDIDGDLPYYLYGDDLRVKQIINNLLGNALKYTQRGLVTFGMSCTYDGSESVWVSAYISDTGIGIRAEDLKKLFIDYSQVDTRANRRIEGTGLGLSITKMLVEQMGGEISVESEYGKGSTFRFKIKQGFVSDKTIGQETAEYLCNFRYMDKKKRAHEKIVRPDLSYASVLVVDDMQTNLDVATGMLKKYKMQVDCVLSGQEAIDRIDGGKPVYDAIFMDHMMPGMDGVETAKKIRDIGTRYAMTVPIIALTANAIAGNEQMFLNNSFQAFLAKPINIMHLDVVVKRWVRDKTRE